MRICLFIFVLLCLLLGVNPVFAGDPPILISPVNNSTATSSKLEWQTPSYPLYTGGSYYMVQVDDQQTFADPEKNNIYLTNNYYTPQLNPGIWYWRVKAKDLSGTWSDWANAWSFTLVTTTSTPTLSPTPTQTPTHTQATTPISTSAPTPTTSSSSSQSSQFTVSNVPTQINSDQSFTASVNLNSPNSPNTTYYLAGAFKIVEGTRYFGLTKTDSGWVQYSSSNFSNQYKITTDLSGTWAGNLEVKPDKDDSDFKGSGDYIFKVAKYTQAGSQTWSNETTIKIIDTSNSQSLNTSTPTPTTTPSTTTIKTIPSKSIISPSVKIASVAGISKSATSSPTPQALVKSERKMNLLTIVGSIFVITGLGVSGFLYFKHKKL